MSEQRFQSSQEAGGNGGLKKRERGRSAYWLFLLPFFWWYQMAWVPITVVLTLFVYRATTKRER